MMQFLGFIIYQTVFGVINSIKTANLFTSFAVIAFRWKNASVAK